MRHHVVQFNRGTGGNKSFQPAPANMLDFFCYKSYICIKKVAYI